MHLKERTVNQLTLSQLAVTLQPSLLETPE